MSMSAGLAVYRCDSPEDEDGVYDGRGEDATFDLRLALPYLRLGRIRAIARNEDARVPAWLRDWWPGRAVTERAVELPSRAAGPLAIAVALWDQGYSWRGIASALGVEPRCALDERWSATEEHRACPSLGELAWGGRSAGLSYGIIGACLRIGTHRAYHAGSQWARRHKLMLVHDHQLLRADGRVTDLWGRTVEAE